MSQIAIPVSTKTIEKQLPRKLMDPDVLDNTEKLSIWIKSLSDIGLVYLEARQQNSKSRSKSRIQNIDKIKKNVFESSKMKYVGFESTKNNEEDRSHQLAIQLREMVGLKPLKKRARVDAIRDLKGILQDYSDGEEDPVDAIKNSREY